MDSRRLAYSAGLGSKAAPPTGVVALAYAVLLASGAAMFHVVAAGEFSSIVTMATMLQTFAFSLLALQIVFFGSASGISAKALQLDALSLIFCLSSTLWLNGYLPVDESGDWVYQATQLSSLAILLWLLHQILVVKRSSYQAAEDSFPIVLVVIGSVFLALVFHADMNDRPLFDTLWMAGLFISVFAVLPQLWLNTKSGGNVEAFTSHYIAAMALSRALSGLFMYHAREDITCAEWIDGWNHSIWAILGAHLLHMLLLGDFAYYYVRALAKGEIANGLQLNDELWV